MAKMASTFPCSANGRAGMLAQSPDSSEAGGVLNDMCFHFHTPVQDDL